VLRNSVVGPHVTVGEGVLIERCVVADSVIGRNSHLKGVVLKGSMLGAGTRVQQRNRSLSIGDDSTLEI